MDTGPRWRPGWRPVAAGVAITVAAVVLFGLPVNLDERFLRKGEGAHWLRESARLDAKDFWAHYHLGHTLRDLGQVPEAISVYERALSLKPGFPEVEMELALLRKAELPKRP